MYLSPDEIILIIVAGLVSTAAITTGLLRGHWYEIIVGVGGLLLIGWTIWKASPGAKE